MFGHYRLAALIAWTHLLLWNVGTLPSGEYHAWAGTLVRFDRGPHVFLSWDDDGILWSVSWCDRQDPWDPYYAWGWYAEGRVGGETTIITP